MSNINITSLQEYTKLPLSIIQLEGKVFPDIRVETPHKGTVTIKLKKTHYPFLVGSVTQTDKSSKEVLHEIWKLEHESMNYLLKQWKKEIGH